MKIAVIISDGRQRNVRGVEPLDLAAQPLHSLGTKVYVIGSGSNVDIDQLQRITHEPGNLFITRSYDDLLAQIIFVLSEISIGKVLVPICYSFLFCQLM